MEFPLFCNEIKSIVTVHEHSFKPSLLNRESKVLDVGCRDFQFAQWFIDNIGCKVTCIDADPTIKDPKIKGVTFLNKAVTHSDKEKLRLFAFGNGSGSYTEEVFERPSECKEYEVETYRITPFWDLIKLDCEGAEYEILMNMTEPLAKQISVEFHEHTPAAKGQLYISKLFNHLWQWYDIHGDVQEKRHGCGENYWDVLFILK